MRAGAAARPERPGGTGGRGGSSAGSGGQGGTGGAGLTCGTPVPGTGYTVDATGVTFTLSSGRMKVQVCKEDIIRVLYTTATTFPSKTSLSVSNTWTPPTPFCLSEAAGTVTITTARMKAKVNTTSGVVTYTDLGDSVVLAEDSKTVTAATVEGTSTNRIQTVFNSPSNEALFGLGQHQNDVINRKGTTQRILNANTQINVPVLVSNRGYGIFWDNYSASDFYGNDTNNTKYRYVSEAGEMVDYYFFYGPTIDQVIAGYRTATGAAPLFGKWAYGLFHSKDKYGSQTELLNVKNGYRNNNIPLDCIVQDWDYWTPHSWGSHFMDAARYPDPASLVTQMHAANVHTMISIWPVYQYVASPRMAGDQDNYNALNGIGALYATSGSHHFYDTFNAAARTLVYQQIYDRLLGKYGWDGIWADNTEPQAYPDPVNVRAATTALGKGALYINAYPLQHSKALYEGWRRVGPNGKRVYNLTRSGFAGQQRYATTCWSGDIDSNFPTYARQVPAGLNFSITGIPYWTTDIGGYWGHDVDWTTSANNELFTRWFQYGAFCPIFRVHGGGARELYGNQWNATTKANLLKIDNVRYRLMPYIYSLAGKSHARSVHNDAPIGVRLSKRRQRVQHQGSVHVWSGVPGESGAHRGRHQPVGLFPCRDLVRLLDGSDDERRQPGDRDRASDPNPPLCQGGSIVPMGPIIQYATQSIDPLEIRIYKGQNGTFTLYEDEGDTYNYETGQYSRIPFTWNESTRQLTIGARTGSYTGMPTNRTFNIVWVGANHGVGVDVTAADQVVRYDGAASGQ